MSRPMDERRVPESLLPEHDEHVDVAVALGRGELSKTQARDVRARMLRDASYRAVVEPIVLAYEEPSLSAEDSAVAWPRFVRAAGLPESVARAAVGKPAEIDRMGRRRMLSMLAGSIAAALSIAAGLGVWDYARDASRYDTIRTGPGETLWVMLPDRTRATIGPNSELKHPKNMWIAGNPDRVVWPMGSVTLEISDPSYKTPPGGRALGPLRIETKHAMVTVAAWAQLKVEALPSSTTVSVLSGTARVWPRFPNRPEPTGSGIEVKAPYGARFTELAMQMFKVTREP